LYADGPKIAFDPPNQDIRSMLQRCIKHIVNGAAHIPRIESHLFDSKTKLLVRHVRHDEEIVDHSTQRVLNVFSKNLPGPKLYLHEYDEYQTLLNNKSETETIEFLRHAHGLDEFELEIKQKTALTNEIILKRISAPLNLFNLDCRDLNDHLIKNVQKLREKLVQYCIEENSRLNKDIVREYDEIATTVSVPADEVEELVRTTDYLAKALETSVYKLAYKIGEAKERLMFLLEYALMPRELFIKTFKGSTDCHAHFPSSGRSEVECASVSLARKYHEYSRLESRTLSCTSVSFVGSIHGR
jgi:dynein heavy chain, axonemal